MYVRAGIPTDVFVQVVDVHGNFAEANQVTTSINASFGELIASPTGLGYWSFTGKQVGVYTLDLQEGDAQHSIEVTVGSGDPIRIQATLSRENLAEGDVVLMEAIGTDAYGNSISIPKENTSVTCTAGDSSFVTNGTWEIDVSEGGTDRSCTIRWNGLLAQTFFDVDEVLLGGAVGSTNTAMTMAAILLFLILAVLIVLNRKASQVAQEDWMDEAFDDEDDSDEEGEELEKLRRKRARENEIFDQYCEYFIAEICGERYTGRADVPHVPTYFYLLQFNRINTHTQNTEITTKLTSSPKPTGNA